MKIEIIILAILAICISAYAADQQKIYFLSMEYEKGTLSLLDIRLTDGFPSVNDRAMPQRAELVSFDGKILYELYFEIPNVIHIPPPLDQSDDPESIVIEKVNFSISIPFYKNATEINIYDGENGRILYINLSSFSDYCGDRRCSITEDANECPKDCSWMGSGNELVFYLGAAVIVAVVLVIIFIKKH